LRFQKELSDIFSKADVQINGSRPFDVKVHDSRAFSKIVTERGDGFAESYVDGWWDCEQLDELVSRLILAGEKIDGQSIGLKLKVLLSLLFNYQAIRRAKKVCEVHYDLGNDLYQKMLDPRMVYSCAYWTGAHHLEEAQENKLDLVCRKLGLKKGMKVLDIGCGWGSFMKFATERYGVQCTGYTLSQRQLELGRELCKNLDIEFRLQDYRQIRGKYDRVVSIGMLEAVGPKNFGTYMEIVARSLTEDGLALIQTIGRNFSTYHTQSWIDRHIFPNGIVPSIQQLGRSFENVLMMEDWHNFGPDYDRTLMEWNLRFQQAWPDLRGEYPERFKRMWEFYLLSFAGNFRARNLHLWQIVLSKPGSRHPLCRIG